jgi:hypothetical protein
MSAHPEVITALSQSISGLLSWRNADHLVSVELHYAVSHDTEATEMDNIQSITMCYTPSDSHTDEINEMDPNGIIPHRLDAYVRVAFQEKLWRWEVTRDGASYMLQSDVLLALVNEYDPETPFYYLGYLVAPPSPA